MKLPLAYYGEAVLRKKCAPVKEITPEIRQLVSDMIETMEANKGIGLAAPQVFHSLRIFITCIPIEDNEGNDLPGKLRVFINPEIVAVCEEEESIYSEGCLSIPKLYGEVARPSTVRVRAMDLDGNIFEEEFSELNAQCVFHENDHINGVLFIDRIHGKERLAMEPKLREIKKKFFKKQ